MDHEPDQATDDRSRREEGQLVKSLVQVGEVLLKVFLATALTVGVLRGGEVEALGDATTPIVAALRGSPAHGNVHGLASIEVETRVVLGAPYETIGIATT
ncbi:MAG: hypothetical protein ACR2LS_05390 [Thermomicrobiales bacterium]